jgi:hypothetical protein
MKSESYLFNFRHGYSKVKGIEIGKAIHQITLTEGWESAHCDVHNGPFHGTPKKLADGRTCCAKCWCDGKVFNQSNFRLRKLT